MNIVHIPNNYYIAGSDVLTKLRKFIKPMTNHLGCTLANMGIRPNHITYLGLFTSALVPVSAYLLGPSFLIPLLIAISSFLDLLDGAIAKAANLKSTFGSFLDSVSDRFSDAMYILSLSILGLNHVLVILFLAFSFLISYIRAKAESLGLKIEGIGLMERGDRIIALLAITVLITLGLNTYATYLLIVSLLLCLVTVIHRGVYVWRKLKK